MDLSDEVSSECAWPERRRSRGIAYGSASQVFKYIENSVEGLRRSDRCIATFESHHVHEYEVMLSLICAKNLYILVNWCYDH